MLDRQLPDLADSLEWNLIRRHQVEGRLEGNRFYIPPQTYVISSAVVAVGLRNDAAPGNWFLAGWADQLLLFSPSSGTSEYPAAVATGSQRLRLNTLNLVVAPNYLRPWLLELRFARWHGRINIEVWRYDGRDVSQFQRFDDLEARLNQPEIL